MKKHMFCFILSVAILTISPLFAMDNELQEGRSSSMVKFDCLPEDSQKEIISWATSNLQLPKNVIVIDDTASCETALQYAQKKLVQKKFVPSIVLVNKFWNTTFKKIIPFFGIDLTFQNSFLKSCESKPSGPYYLVSSQIGQKVCDQEEAIKEQSKNASVFPLPGTNYGALTASFSFRKLMASCPRVCSVTLYMPHTNTEEYGKFSQKSCTLLNTFYPLCEMTKNPLFQLQSLTVVSPNISDEEVLSKLVKMAPNLQHLCVLPFEKQFGTSTQFSKCWELMGPTLTTLEWKRAPISDETADLICAAVKDGKRPLAILNLEEAQVSEEKKAAIKEAAQLNDKINITLD